MITQGAILTALNGDISNMKPSKAIKIYKDRAYHVSEKTVKEYESGKIHFEDHYGNRVTPSYFGRSGDGFNATFKIVATALL